MNQNYYSNVWHAIISESSNNDFSLNTIYCFHNYYFLIHIIKFKHYSRPHSYNTIRKVLVHYLFYI